MGRVSSSGDGSVDPRRVDLLTQWLDAGLELGNRAYSHPDLHSTPLEAFEENVVNGEEDPAYQTLDTYVGPGGITRLHRRALTAGMPKASYAGEPETPAFVAEAAKP